MVSHKSKKWARLEGRGGVERESIWHWFYLHTASGSEGRDLIIQDLQGVTIAQGVYVYLICITLYYLLSRFDPPLAFYFSGFNEKQRL